jgi:hypothetical protein
MNIFDQFEPEEDILEKGNHILINTIIFRKTF